MWWQNDFVMAFLGMESIIGKNRNKLAMALRHYWDKITAKLQHWKEWCFTALYNITFWGIKPTHVTKKKKKNMDEILSLLHQCENLLRATIGLFDELQNQEECRLRTLVEMLIPVTFMMMAMVLTTRLSCSLCIWFFQFQAVAFPKKITSWRIHMKQRRVLLEKRTWPILELIRW